MSVNLRSIRSFPATGRNKSGANNSKCKEYDLKSPDGEVFRGKGVRSFAKEHGLSEECLYLVLNGKAVSHKGWTKAHKGREGKIYTYYFFSPDGEYHETSQLGEFARQKGLSRKSLHALSSGVANSYKGWVACDANQKLISEPIKKGKPFTLIDPDGNIVEGFNISEFARANGLVPGSLINVLNGRRKTCNGWKVPEFKPKQLTLFDFSF